MGTSVPPTSDPTAVEFAPDLLRRALSPLAKVLGPRLLGRSQEMTASQFTALGLQPSQVVMLGDSITHLGNWDEWFPDLPVRNRGSSGETSADLLRRLDSAVNSPAAVFILIGTNDVTTGITLAAIVANVTSLLDELERRTPGSPVVVQSVMPRSARYRDDVQRLNNAFRSVVENAGANVEYLDLWPALADDNGELRKEFTADSLHLSGPGYAAWVDVLRPTIDRLLARP